MRPWVLPLLGLGAILSAALLYQDRGWQTPRDAGIVPSVLEPITLAEPVGTPDPARSPVTARSPRPTTRPALPVSLSIASVAVVQAPVLPVTVSDGRLGVPQNPRTLGWWTGGAAPGSLSGSVVIVGHVDSARLGRGVFFHLSSLAMGARVSVRTDTGRSLAYRVVGRRVYAKTSLPAGVFATTGPPRLVLITCGGPFNTVTRHYRDNVVVYAVPSA